MILIIGATGMVGSEICRLLRGSNKSVRAMVRDTTAPEKRDALEKLGVQIVKGDLRNRSTFGPALNDVSAVITTVSSVPFTYVPGENDIDKVDREGMLNLIDAACDAGIQHFVYTSFSGDIDADFPLRNAKRKVEEHLKNSGMNYTILRPGYLMEVWLSPAVGFNFEEGKVQLCGDGTQSVSYISISDVARFAAESLENPAAHHAVLELGGPDKVTQLEAVKIFESASGKEFEVQSIPKETLEAQMGQVDDPMQKSYAALMVQLADGNPIDMEGILQQFPLQLTSVKEFARRKGEVAAV